MPHKLQSNIDRISSEMQRLAERVFPIEGGKLAMRHFQDNFHKGGFVNGGLQPWQKSKRLEGGGAASQHGTLMSPNKVLYGGIKYSPSVGRVTLFNDVPYASIHQTGGVTHPRITPKMRAYAWWRYFQAAGIKKGAPKKKQKEGAEDAPPPINEAAMRWKRLALTKKETLTIRIPARPFIGESRELSAKIKEMMSKELIKSLKNGKIIP